MQNLEFDQTICGVNLRLNAIDFQSDCPFQLSSESSSADYFQILFLKKVQGHLKLNDQIIELQPNSIVFISKYQHHSWHGDFSNLEGQLLLFQDDFLNDFFSDQYFIFRLLFFYQTKHPLILEVDDSYMSDNLSKLTLIKQELVSPKDDSVHLIRSLLYYILIDLNRTYSKINQLNEAISTDSTAYQFRKMVEENICTLQRVEEYAEKMHISRISLNKAVKTKFNVTASDFIKSRLLYEIKMRLVHSNKTIAEIANDLHFSEANHLSRFFKQKTKQSPADYRLNYQNGSHL